MQLSKSKNSWKNILWTFAWKLLKNSKFSIIQYCCILFFFKKTMKNKLTVVFPTRPNIQNIKWLLWSLDQQTFQDFKVIGIIDSKLTQKEFDELKKESLDWLKNIQDRVYFISNVNSDFVPQKWVSYVRNYGIKLADTEFLNLFDDDEILKPDYLEKSFEIYGRIKSSPNPFLEKEGEHSPLFFKEGNKGWFKEFVLVPKLMFRQTWKIQNEWFDYYNFWTSRPHQFHFKWEKFAQIQMYSWNSLFWPTKIFQEVLFDERFDFVYEDLEFTYRIHKAGYPIFISSELEIFHMERDKTLLEDARIGSEFQCHRKARHRMRFVRKNATIIQKIQFYLLWFWAQPLRLISKIIRLAPKKDRKTLIWALICGTRDWMKN